MTNSTKRFILVDDDPFNNILSKMVLKKLLGEVEVKDFIIPEDALDYIKNEYENRRIEEKTTLLLDINMPTLSGWDFLEIFEAFKEPIKNQFNIFMLSSSIDPADIKRAKLNPLVIDYIEKPLNKAILSRIFSFTDNNVI